MILDDLVAHVTLATAGWLAEKNSTGATTLAWRSQKNLMTIAKSISPNSSMTENGLGWRRPLLRNINKIGDSLVVEILLNLESIRTSKVGFFWGDRYDGTKFVDEYEPLDAFVPIIEFFENFKFSARVRNLPLSQQKPFIQTLELMCDHELIRVHLEFAKEDKAADLVVQRSQELEESSITLSSIRTTLGEPAIALLAEIETSVSLHGAPYKQIAIRIAASADLEVIKSTAKLYEGLARELSYDFEPADPNTPSKILSATKTAWATLRDCGQTFLILASWLQASTISEAARRCQLCYRHLGQNLKHFCVEHKRTSQKRQPARDLRVATVYKVTHNEFVSSLPNIEDLFGHTALNHIQENDFLRLIAKRHVFPELVPAAAQLAALLRQMYPVIAPILQNVIANHFAAMLVAANAPFNRSGHYATMAQWEVSRFKALAPQWLNIFNFFITFYGNGMPGPSAIAFENFKGLDVDHPLVHGQAMLPRKLAIDLGHLKCWQAADDAFDERFFLSLATVSKLRNTVDPKSKKPMSLSDIAKEVGTSREAVREILVFASGLSSSPNRRDRILPTKKAFLFRPIELVPIDSLKPAGLMEQRSSPSPKIRSLFSRR